MDAMTRTAARTIISELGLGRGLLTLAEVGWRQSRGEPFRAYHLTNAQGVGHPGANPDELTTRERQSRAQLGPAVVLYRALRKRLDEARALDVTGRVITASGRVFLSQVLATLDLSQVRALSHAERDTYLRSLLAPIPNATFELSFDEQDRVHFTVNGCRFVTLCHELGHPELAPLFCAVDDHYFRFDLPQVQLERATTIAHGGAQCPFILSVRDADPSVRDADPSVRDADPSVRDADPESLSPPSL